MQVTWELQPQAHTLQRPELDNREMTFWGSNVALWEGSIYMSFWGGILIPLFRYWAFVMGGSRYLQKPIETTLRRMVCARQDKTRLRKFLNNNLENPNLLVRPFFLSDVCSIWSFPSFSSLSDYSIWRSRRLLSPCDHSVWSIWVCCPQVPVSLRKNGQEEPRLLNLRRLWSSRKSSSAFLLALRTLLRTLCCRRGKFFYLQLELFCLQLSFFAYTPLRPLLDALSHCKRKSSNCK